jgi:ABC-type multidrug transport system permease subunit
VLGTVLLTLPLFFSGIAFSTELKCTASVAGALSANLLGSMLGGLLEYNSMYFGIRSLYVIALLMYGLAAFFALRRRRAT